MATLTLIDQFEVMYSANGYPPRLWLRGAGKPLGQLVFMPNGAALPADTINNGHVNLYYHLENFSSMLELFRGEKTLYLLWSGSGSGFENGIQTAQQVLGT